MQQDELNVKLSKSIFDLLQIIEQLSELVVENNELPRND